MEVICELSKEGSRKNYKLEGKRENTFDQKIDL